MFISKKGLQLIKDFEGLKLKSYLCPAGVPTIGYGHTKNVKAGQVITEDEAGKFLIEDVWYFERGVDDLVHVPLTQGQFDALVSFGFNVGLDIDDDQIPEGLGDSTLLKLLNRGDYAGASNQFPLWNKAGGKPSAGLTRRRLAEQRLFLTGNY